MKITKYNYKESSYKTSIQYYKFTNKISSSWYEIYNWGFISNAGYVVNKYAIE